MIFIVLIQNYLNTLQAVCEYQSIVYQIQIALVLNSCRQSLAQPTYFENLSLTSARNRFKRRSTTSPLTAQTGIVWFGKHNWGSSTTKRRSRRSREFLVTFF